MEKPLKPVALDSDSCRERQKNLATILQDQGADRALLLCPEHVQYLTGFKPHRLMLAAVCLEANGHCLLVAPNEKPESAADDVVTFEAQWCSTIRQDQPTAVAKVLTEIFQNRPTAKRLAVEYSSYAPHFRDALSCTQDLIDIESNLWQLRRRKDPDELAMIRQAIACTQAMYARARSIIKPGITEIEVFNQLSSAAVETAGELLTGIGNDYQANSPGGPPRVRKAQAGELFVLDLGAAYRGYYADNCRTFTVGKPPNEDQQLAWDHIVATLDMVEQTVKPGISCRELFQRAQKRLDEYRPGAFFHHLGHGIGLFPREGPHLNPNWDDTFQEGDVFTAEPGLYGPELKAGIRLEQNYVVTANGVERLTSFPLDL